MDITKRVTNLTCHLHPTMPTGTNRSHGRWAAQSHSTNTEVGTEVDMKVEVTAEELNQGEAELKGGSRGVTTHH